MSDDCDDGCSQSSGERPSVKKPRYAWQIQGRYRFTQNELPRDDRGECSSSSSRPLTPPATTSSSPLRSSSASNPSRRLEFFTWEVQESKALLDNLLNVAIEQGAFPSSQIDNIIDRYSRTTGQESLVSNNNRHLEDEAVRMAIRCHGLQKHCYVSLPPFQQPQLHKHSAQSLPFRPRPSTSAKSLQLEQDLLSDAVSVAIQSKGLGTSFSHR